MARCANLLARLAESPRRAALFLDIDGVLAPIVPLLLLLCAWEARAATATSLAAIGVTAVSGVIAYAFHGDVQVEYAALLGLPAAVSVAGATALQQRLRSRTVELLFAVFILGVAVWLFAK